MRLKIRTGQCLGWQGFYGLVDGVQSLCSSLPNKKLNNLSLYCACAPAMQTTPPCTIILSQFRVFGKWKNAPDLTA